MNGEGNISCFFHRKLVFFEFGDMAKTGVVLLGKSYNSSRIVVDLIFSCID